MQYDFDDAVRTEITEATPLVPIVVDAGFVAGFHNIFRRTEDAPVMCVWMKSSGSSLPT